jgi:hypothetical protein
MSNHLETAAVRRRWRICATYAGEQEASWPRRDREKTRARARPRSTHSYLALDGGGELDGGGDSHSLELAILKLVIGSPERSRHFPVEALREAFEPICPADFHAALTWLEQQGIFIGQGDLIGLARPVQRLVEFGLIPRV